MTGPLSLAVHVALTVLAYLLAVRLARRLRSPLLNPTLVGVVVIVAYLLVTGTPYAAYARDTRLLTELLGPAVVALAVPLYLERALLRRHARGILLGALAGGLLSVLLGVLIATLLSLPQGWALAVSGRSSSTPINIALARELGGAPSLAAVMSILTGVFGAALGPAWLTLVGVRHPLARGVAMGISAHGIGTARMLDEGRLAGAAAGLGMGLGGLAVAVLLPVVWRWWNPGA